MVYSWNRSSYKIQGVWGKRVGDVNTKAYDIDNKYWLLQEQIMFNLSNMICGYNESRVWNIIPFIGGGVGRSMSRNFYGMGLSAGVQSSWRLSKALRVYLEAGWNRWKAMLMAMINILVTVVGILTTTTCMLKSV